MSNDTENKLNPCPFCGGKCDIVRGESVSDALRHGRFWRVFCTRCQVRQLLHKTKDEAVKAWNHRVSRNHPIQKPQTTDEWYNSLSEVEKIDAVNCVHDMRGKWNGMNVVFYQGLKIDKRKFDWIKRNITGSKL